MNPKVIFSHHFDSLLTFHQFDQILSKNHCKKLQYNNEMQRRLINLSSALQNEHNKRPLQRNNEIDVLVNCLARMIQMAI